MNNARIYWLALALGIAEASCGGAAADDSKPNVDASANVRDAAVDVSHPMSDAAADHATQDDAAPRYPAPHPSAPQIASGGTIDSSPKIVTVSFSGDPLESDIDAFATAIGTTTYWGDRTKEYDIGPLMPVGRIHDPTVWPATVDDAQIEQWLVNQFNGDAGWPAADPSTVYALVFPPGVSITDTAQGLGPSCGTASMPSWHGYHSSVELLSGMQILYAVISRCDSIPEDPAATGIQYVSAVMSHEVIEAITDPLVISGVYGYFGTDPDHTAFELATGAELADMCALVGNAFYTPTDFPYVVQRIWSNKVAPTGHDPCLPEPGGQVYFNSAPVLEDTVMVPSVYGPGFVKSQGATIDVGKKKTIEVDLFSEAGTAGAWTVRAEETDGTNSLAFDWDKTTGQNGDKLHLTITVLSGTPGVNAESFVVISTLGTQLSFWAGWVGN